jgi:hypothetical protein
MTERGSPAGLLDQARALLEQVTTLAVSARPEDLDASLGPLDRAAGLLEQAILAARTQAARPAPEQRKALACFQAGLERFHAELKKVTRLHEHANAVHSGWIELLGASLGAGYSLRGGATLAVLAAAHSSGRRVSLEA